MKRTDNKNDWGLKYGMVPFLADSIDANKLTEGGKWRASVKGEKIPIGAQSLTVNGEWVTSGFVGHTVGEGSISKLTLRFPFSTPKPDFYGTEEFWVDEKKAYLEGFEVECSDNSPEGWLEWVSCSKKPRWNKPWITRYRVKLGVNEKDRALSKSFQMYEEAKNRITPSTTQPQAKGEFGELDLYLPWKRDESDDGVILDREGDLFLDLESSGFASPRLQKAAAKRIVSCVNFLAGHDLTKVAVVDEDTMEGLQGFLDSLQENFKGTLMGNEAKYLLAKLNAGGEG